MTATCISSIVQSVKVTLAIEHGHLGQLTVKLRAPNNQVIALFSRPGVSEGADDGSGILSGDSSNLEKGSPISMDDAANPSAENLGSGLFSWETACKDDAVCSYKPAKGSASGPTTLTAAFAGVDAVGKWTLCVGDSNLLVTGTLEQWGLVAQTSGGTITRQTAANLAQAIPDDAYDGTLGSMACRDLVVQ
jgi:subtilisin-like proprotein convertase family protein